MPSSGASRPVSAVSTRQFRYSSRVIHSRHLNFLVSQPAMPTWSGCMWVTKMRLRLLPCVACAEQLAPGGQRLVGAHPRVHHRPAVVFLDAPDVDVVQHHRQRHAHPHHAGRHLERRARLGRLLEGVDQRGFGQPVALSSDLSHRGVLAKCSAHQAAAADPALPVRQRRPLEGERRRRCGGGPIYRGAMRMAPSMRTDSPFM